MTTRNCFGLGILVSLIASMAIAQELPHFNLSENNVVDNHKYYIRKTIEEAEKAKKEGNLPFAAILVAQDGTVLHIARNKVNTLKNVLRHAEMEILDKIDQKKPEKYVGSILYTSTEPCPMCTAAVAKMSTYISKIVYGCSIKTLAKYSLKRRETLPSSKLLSLINSRVGVEGPILETEAEKIHMSYWKKD